ncbi:BolA family protein [Fodinicurvata fenggangensis]|uniref:BolA family protein n=1 Tax=Fodinicurvata fenggangensis TaxID=1121830 RepID=UPI001FDF8726|nr:BolA family protein [Fodinicurvata fenggangensis]
MSMPTDSSSGAGRAPSMKQRIEDKLRAGLAPQRLEVADDSHKHEGHSGWQPGGETHFRVEVVSQAFEGENRVARQRRVYALLSEEMAERIHALQIRTLTPDEDAG